MYKCKNCGAEVDGAFCPACGTKRDDDVCPVCGTPRENMAGFCSKCGYNFAGAQGATSVPPVGMPNYGMATPVAKAKPTPLATFYKLAVVIGFGVLSLLMFAFYAIPLTPFGGNLYEFAIYFFTGGAFDSDVGNAIFAMIAHYLAFFLPIVGVISLIVSGFMLLTQNKRFKQMETGALVYYVLYIAIAIMLLVLYGGGAAPILMLVFSILFLAGTIVILVLRKNFYKQHPEFDRQI